MQIAPAICHKGEGQLPTCAAMQFATRFVEAQSAPPPFHGGGWEGVQLPLAPPLCEGGGVPLRFHLLPTFLHLLNR